MRLRDQVSGFLAPWVQLLARVVANNPRGDVYDLLARSDVSHRLEQGLRVSHIAALDELQRAWAADVGSSYRRALLADLDRSYAEAEALLRAAAVRAAGRVPPEEFVPGLHPPGGNPAAEAALRRAREVAADVTAAVRYMGWRSELTVKAARTRHAAEALLREEPGSGWAKQWVSRQDDKVCPWCRWLDGQLMPADQEFGPLPDIGGHQPPRVYQDLLAPPCHPQCRCHIVLVRASEVAASNQSGVSVVTAGLTPNTTWISAADVRAMPAGRYEVLTAFYREAVRKLALSGTRQV